MADSERDTASCSGGDEDSRSGLHSPSASEDSVEVQVTPISLRNKRKLAEPRKIQEPSTAPLKKRRFHHIEETVVVDEESRSISSPSPFRPWIIPRTSSDASKTSTTTSTITTVSGETTTTTTVAATTTTTTTETSTISSTASTISKTTSEETVDDQPHVEVERGEHDETRDQDETMQRLQESLRRIQQATSHNRSLVLSRREPRQRLDEAATPSPAAPAPVSLPQLRLQEEPLSLVMRDEALRVPSHPAVSGTYEKTPSYMMEHLLASSSQSHRNHRDHMSPQQAQQRHRGTAVAASSSSSSSSHMRHHQGVGGGGSSGGGGSGQQRNYKNMTRERRIEANARERTRVHTISAAFDTLRRAIPAYSHNQKLSKLSVLRIACSYIVTLTKIRKMLEGEAPSGASLAACVDQVSRTIQTEGKLRKRKDE